MKQKDFISFAMKEDLSAGTFDAILHRIQEQQDKKGGCRMRFPAAGIAAIVCLLAVSVSAALLSSGFGSAFDVPLDTGTVEILDTVSTNKDVTWNITEVWFDENNFHIGGCVTAPDALAADRSYLAMCYVKGPGDTEHHGIPVYLFPNGEKTAPFIVSGFQYRDDSGNWIRHGYPGDTVTLELTFAWLQDLTDMPSYYTFSAEDFVICPGTWTYTARLTSSDRTGISLTDPLERTDLSGETIFVDSVSINPFSLEIVGENLMHDDESEAEDTPEHEYAVFIRMKDGTLLGKESGLHAHTGNRFDYRSCSEEHLLFCFHKPIDPSQAVSIVFWQEWATFPGDAEDYLTENGWDYAVSPEDETRLEGWKTVIEIPLTGR